VLSVPKIIKVGGLGRHLTKFWQK